MAILWADGFDDWTAASSGVAGEYDSYVANSVSILSTGGRRGGGAVQMSSFSDHLTKGLGGTFGELFFAFAFRPGANGAHAMLQLRNGATAVFTVRWNTDGSVSLMSGDFGTVLATSSAGVMPQGVYTHVQLRVVFATSGGTAQLRLDGATTNLLSATGNTGAACTACAIAIGAGLSAAAAAWDDFVVADTSGSVANTWLGDVRVDSYRPNANGDLSQMVGSDGNSTDNYALVNPATAGSSYVQSATVGAEDLYHVTDMSHTPQSILGVVATAAALKDDAGTRAIRLHAKSGAVDARSDADIVLSTTRRRVTTVFSTDPNTGAAWTRTGLNAAQFGFEVTV